MASRASSIVVALVALTMFPEALAFVFPGPLFSRTAAPSSASSKVVMSAAAPLTKWDRMSTNWKGARRTANLDKAGFGYDEFSTFLEGQDYKFARGDVITGTVVQFDFQGALVDIGAKAAAFMPIREASLIPVSDVGEVLDIHESREFQIISDEDDQGQLQVSLRRLEFQKAWDHIMSIQSEDKALDCDVLGVNRGGAIVSVHGLRAFLPGSHLCGVLPTDDIIGQTLKVKFLEVNQENNKIIVSNRRAVVEDQMQELARGDVVQGVVKAIKPYGAFVEISGMSGLLHISQISYDRIDDLSTIIQPNTIIKCMIIDHDKVNGRIALSTKTLEPEPGDMMKDSQRVFDLAEETAAKYHERMEAERKAREEAAKDIVMGLGDDLDSTLPGASPLGDILSPATSSDGEADKEAEA
uniref:S1 motif domain-containing protein n=1 Tax=Rhizochromulina marina TaxID=1034831 RepID=A0A7S2SEK7_9STRA|mmetsp:Transcript_2908/g.8279  ORF Transcript_2908/g.8279 Transcript_2908/m.8279 type:complete len:412 (+) Transcript_2908:169-1404(+)